MRTTTALGVAIVAMLAASSATAGPADVDRIRREIHQDHSDGPVYGYGGGMDSHARSRYRPIAVYGGGDGGGSGGSGGGSAGADSGSGDGPGDAGGGSPGGDSGPGAGGGDPGPQ